MGLRTRILCIALVSLALPVLPAVAGSGSGSGDGPSATLNATPDATNGAATLTATVRGVSQSGVAFFQWAPVGSSTLQKTAEVPFVGNSHQAITAALAGLQPGRYGFRLVVRVQSETLASQTSQFTLSAPPAAAPTPTPAPAPTPTPAPTTGTTPAPPATGTTQPSTGSTPKKTKTKTKKPKGTSSTGSGTTTGDGSSTAGSTDTPTPTDTTPTEPAPVTAPAADAPASTPAPALGGNVVAAPESGAVTVQTPGHDAAPLTDTSNLPSGSVVDATHGRITLTAKRSAGAVNSATFWGARFKIRHPHGDPGLTEIVLKGKPSCPAPGQARTAAASKPPELWGHDHHGRFSTRGRNAVATVRGTTWYMAETCKGTVVGVLTGTVEVRNRWTGKVTELHGSDDSGATP